MSEQQSTGGQISARTIQAENIVSGVQAFDVADAQALLSVARNVRAGNVTAEEIRAANVVAGLQITNESQEAANSTAAISAQLDKVRSSLASLDEQSHSLISPRDQSDLNDEISKLAQELDDDAPTLTRIRRTATNISDIIDSSATAAERAGKLTTSLSGLALQGAALWHLVSQLFT